MLPTTANDAAQTIPQSVLEKIHQHFPDRQLKELTIRYYEDVRDVGYEYFMNTVLPVCHHSDLVQYLEPFISFVNLGETLVLARQGLVIYDNEQRGECTETGPFWFVSLEPY
ncbi:hypothetical protein [Pantanalinema sp. GBBB05]|uniref:hypothetical protein n=1 Tax=Pantanalinema sp. GBBB05 TaxID=2604139 RepID=UPI001DE5961E|nr:hypothetical protein [Pantanalinema sp. GBBB05]